jgi:hypothetical protein
MFVAFAALACLCAGSQAFAQSASVLYTFDNTGNASPNIEQWIKGFGAGSTSATLDNNTLGTLTITETSSAAGGSQAFSDGFNRIREAPVNGPNGNPSGGLDLTGLDYLEWDLGHNGPPLSTVDVQFYVQATPASTFVAISGEVSVGPGINTYQVPLTGLTADQLVYVRTLGINIRDHAGLGNLVWSVNEVRSGGSELKNRMLISHAPGTPEGGLQGAIVNFDNAAVLGNNGGQNQTGLSHDAATGSLMWTDVGGQGGAAMSWGNGTAWNGNTFNNRAADLSNYKTMYLRISVTDPNNGGGDLGLNAFFQKNNFVFENAEGGAGRNIPIDGRFHTVSWSLAGLSDMNVVDLTGINLFAHPQNLEIRVDYIRFNVPEPLSLALAGIGAIGLCFVRRKRLVG